MIAKRVKDTFQNAFVRLETKYANFTNGQVKVIIGQGCNHGDFYNILAPFNVFAQIIDKIPQLMQGWGEI